MYYFLLFYRLYLGKFENEQNQSNIVEGSRNEEIIMGNSNIESGTYKKKRGKSSLWMIDEISLQKIRRGDLEKVRELVIQEKEENKFTTHTDNVEKELSFKGDDVSMNHTILDDSVIIHKQINKIDINASQLGVFDTSGYDISNYYGENDKSPQVNISNMNQNLSKIDNDQAKAQPSIPPLQPIQQQTTQDRPMLSTLEALKRKAKEAREQENKIKQQNSHTPTPEQVIIQSKVPSQPNHPVPFEQDDQPKTGFITKSPSQTLATTSAQIQQKKEEAIVNQDPKSKCANLIVNRW